MTPWVLRLLVANLAIFLVTSTNRGFFNLLALAPWAILERPWTVVTYMFVHGGFGHIFFNMLGLFFFGPRLEQHLGGRSFLWLYFLSGLGGAAFSFIFAREAAVVGASGAVFGVLLGFAYFWPKERIYIWGVFPVEARWLVAVLAIMALWSGMSGAQGNVAHFAHLGGFAFGYGYLRWRRHRYMAQWKPVPTPKEVLSRSAPRGDDNEAVRRWRSIRVEELHQLNREEVERLLAKVAERGAGALTPDEREMLERFAARH